jgi:ribosomally synthesized peptide (two-chain TOMM family)
MIAEMSEFGMVWPRCIARAWEDSQFREALKSDPVGTLLNAFQFKVPAGIEFQVVESDQSHEAPRANALRMVIPPKPVMDMEEIALVGPVENHQGPHGRPFTFSLTFSFC